jgi:phosphatidylinositol alpha-1,6-mannosyltransferase
VLGTDVSPSHGVGALSIQTIEGLGRTSSHREGSLLALRAYPDLELPSGWTLHLARRKIVFVVRALFLAVRDRPHDIVVLHLSLMPVGSLAAKLAGGQTTLLTHGWEVMFCRRPMERWCGYRADRMLAVSRATALGVARLLPRKDARRFGTIGILSPTWNQDHVTTAPQALGRARLGLDPDDLVLLTVGRMDSSQRGKGHDRVLDVLPELLTRYPKLRYLIVGQGDDRCRLMGRARDLHVEHRVTFTGYVEELALCYAACDLFVMPSTQEGFGIVFLEALANGRPVVAGGIDGSIEAVGWGELGFLCDPLVSGSVANAIRRAIDALGHPDPRVDSDFLRTETQSRYGRDAFDRRLSQFFGTSETS